VATPTLPQASLICRVSVCIPAPAPEKKISPLSAWQDPDSMVQLTTLSLPPVPAGSLAV
jgi:hypothetical protein